MKNSGSSRRGDHGRNFGNRDHSSSRSNNNSNNNNNNNNNDQHSSSQYDKRKNQSSRDLNPQKSSNQSQQQQQQKSPNQPQSQQHHHHYQQQQQNTQFNNNRERSSQRNPQQDISANRDTINASNLGSVRFTPGLSTRELPQIETKADANKKFTGRCRLFVGNLPHNTTEDRLRALFEPFGQIGEVFLGPKSAFAFVKMDTRQNAEAARDALDCSTYEGRTLRVRVAAHAAAIRVKHLSPVVTNELLAYAFRYFGEIERAIVVVDDKGRSIGEGIVEYSKKQSALYAIKRCQQECFLLTAAPNPVQVDPYDQLDEDEGLPEKSVNKNSIEFKEQRDVGPRFAEQGSFEHSFAAKWKELYNVEKQKRERLEEEIKDSRKNLQNQIEESRMEHEKMQLTSRLQQLEDNAARLRQMKAQSLGGTTAQQRDEQRGQQDMLLRQREDGFLRRVQMNQTNDLNGMNQQETTLGMQANTLQNLITSQEQSAGGESEPDPSSNLQSSGSQEQESGPHMGMIPPQQRPFAGAAMMTMAQPYMPIPTTMGIAPTQTSGQMPTPMYTGYIPPPPLQGFGDPTGNSFPSFPSNQGFNSSPQQNPNVAGRQQKFARQQFTNQGNNINVTPTNPNNGRQQRKRGRFL